MARPTGLFGPLALTPLGPPPLRGDVLRHFQWLVEPVSQVQILPCEKKKSAHKCTDFAIWRARQDSNL